MERVLWLPLSPGDGPPCQPVALAPLWGSRCLESVCLNSTALYLALCAGSDVFVFCAQVCSLFSLLYPQFILPPYFHSNNLICKCRILCS